MPKSLTFAILFILCSSSALLAQNAFQTIDVAAGGDFLVGGNSILDHWSDTPGVTLELRTPYYAGEFEAGIRYRRYNEDSFPDSGFQSAFVFLGWHYSIRLQERLHFVPGLRLGNHFLYQDNAKEYFADPPGDPFIFHQNESEFAYELVARFEYRLTDRYGLFGSASFSRTVLEIPFTVAHATVGVSRTFQSPNWLQNLLR